MSLYIRYFIRKKYYEDPTDLPVFQQRIPASGYHCNQFSKSGFHNEIFVYFFTPSRRDKYLKFFFFFDLCLILLIYN